MGHLGNPIAFRLNFEKKWKFNFYVKNIYYPECINNMINIRDYLYYYLTRKKMLQSGICFSHLFLLKYLKKVYVQLYIYHIDMEKGSHELINYLYREYYNAYNHIKYASNKTEKQLNNFFIIREFSNVDLVIFYFTFLLFNQRRHLTKKKDTYLSQNKIYLQTVFYNQYITYCYIKKLLSYYSNNSLLHQTFKWKLKRRIAWSRALKKLKKLKKIKLKICKYFNVRWVSKKVRKRYKKYLPKIESSQAWFIRQQYWLDKWLKYSIERKMNKIFFSLFFKKSKFKFFKKLTNFKLRQWSFKSRKSLYDKAFKNHYFLYSSYYKRKRFNNLRRFNIIILFLYLAKKVKFNKYRNSKSLWKKWAVIYKHFKLLYTAKALKFKNILNIKDFFFILQLFIYLSKRANKQKGIFFNFRNSIYCNIYYGMFNNFFYNGFNMITAFLKTNISLLDPNMQPDNMIFNYYFITNDTVSSQLISRYICLKFKRGFTVRRVLGPLKRELVRVAKRGWGTQKPFIIYHYKKMYKNKKNYLIKTVKSFIKLCYYFYFLNIYKTYKKSNTIIYFSLFRYLKNRCKRKQKQRLIFYLNFNYKTKLYTIYNKTLLLKDFYKDYKIKRNKVKSWLTKFNLGNLFPYIFNFDKKLNWNYNVINSKSNHFLYLNYGFLNSFKAFHVFLFYKKIKKINNKAIAISNHLNNNIFNYGIIKSLWLIYTNFNKRNARNKYMPIFYSGIMGLKMVFKGRFSRKERVSKMVLNMGKVPLNTLKAYIDYDFLTVALKNSAMSFKIYIYRKKILYNYKNKITI